jgi:hypothetical protein
MCTGYKVHCACLLNRAVVTVIVDNNLTIDHQEAAVVTHSLESIVARNTDCDMAPPAQYVVIQHVELVNFGHESVVVRVPDLAGVFLMLDRWSPPSSPDIVPCAGRDVHQICESSGLGVQDVCLEVETVVAGTTDSVAVAMSAVYRKANVIHTAIVP